MKKVLVWSPAFLLLFLCATPFAHAQAPKQMPLTFGPGQTSKTVQGKLVGRQMVDHLIKMKAGQTLSLNFSAKNLSAGYLIYAPNTETAMATSDISGNQATRMMPIDGPVRVRVFINRAAGRRGESTSYSFNAKISGKPLPALSGGQDALVPGTPYHATAEVPFEHYLYKDVKKAKAGVIRRGQGGTATLEFTFKDQKRRVLFVKGKAVASDAPVDVMTTTGGDTIVIRVGLDETYRVNQALLYGG